MEFERLGADLDINYIPKCIQQLNNTENLLVKLVECLDGRNPSEYCKYLPEQHQTTNKQSSSSMFDVTTHTSTTSASSSSLSSASPTSTTSTISTSELDLFSETNLIRSSSWSPPIISTSQREENNQQQDDLDRISTMLLIVLIEFPILALINLVAIGLVIYILLRKKPIMGKLRPMGAGDTRNVNLEGGNANYAFSSTYL